MLLRSTHSPTKMCTRNNFLDACVCVGRGVGGMSSVLKAENFTTFMCHLSRNLGASISLKPPGIFRSVQRFFDPFTLNNRVLK